MATSQLKLAAGVGKKLTLKQVAKDLQVDGLIPPDIAERLSHYQPSKDKVDIHPLITIANRSIKSAKPPHKTLGLEELTQWLADKVGLPYERIDPLKVDVPAVTAVMSYAYAAARKILPVAVKEDVVLVATAEPYVRDWMDEISRVVRKEISLVIANPSEITRYLSEFYSLSRAMQRASSNESEDRISVISNLEQLLDLGRRGQLDANDHHIVSIVDWLLQYAFDQRASDIHLEPRREKSEVRFRIDGVLHLVYQVPTNVMSAIIARIKTLGRMDVAERRRPLDGRLKTKTPEGQEIELRLSTIPTAHGEKMVMRIFDPTVLVRNFRDLGLGDEEIRQWEGMVKQPHGIVLVTGPTGSGKTTTLYSTLKQLARPEVNVCTIEDPIEMVEPSFNQMQVHHTIGLDFANGVRALLRQDPDIIMIGEIRDYETAEMAIQASLTGHLVLSTLHTNDAPSAVTRLLEIGVPPYLINATVLGIVAQRLVRTLCPHCKAPGTSDNEGWEELVRPWKASKPPKEFYAPQGCLECRQTGYYGRIGIYEIMLLSSALRKLIVPNCDVAPIKSQALKEGMQTLRLSGARKIYSGQTTIEEVMRVAPPPEAL
jgi:general secretion pathway protein E